MIILIMEMGASQIVLELKLAGCVMEEVNLAKTHALLVQQGTLQMIQLTQQHESQSVEMV